MVSAVPIDALSDPTRSLLELYDDNENVDDFPAKVARHFAHIFASKDTFSEIPSIHTVDPRQKDRCLVKFRAMIQDTSYSPEMYLARRSDGQCGGWGLADEASDEFSYADLRENTVVWAVNVPGESDWVSEVEGNAPSFTRSFLPSSHPHKFPIPELPHLGVQVKVYDMSGAEFKSTDVVTLVGIFTMESMSSVLESDNEIPVPTLHVLFSKPHPLPIVLPIISPTSTSATLRDELISWIATEGLAGDRHAAEWVLLNVIAKVQSRTPPLLPPSLTISRFPSPPSQGLTPSLCAVLSQLLPIAVTIPLSLDLLNSLRFSPESKQEELYAGRLQLPRGTACVVTEGGISEGGIVEQGVMNLRALQEMMLNQTLDYAFPFSKFAFNTDVTFLVISEGRKSTFFKTHINIPLQSSTGKSDELYKPANQVKPPPAEILIGFRDLVASAKMGTVTIGDTVSEYIQDDFVKQRKAAAKPTEAVSSDDLIRSMTVARLLTLSMNQSDVSIDIWERTKTLLAANATRLEIIGTTESV